jgi:8-oxo-dGTP pyrophosphatase MutT (NUDIX family)
MIEPLPKLPELPVSRTIIRTNGKSVKTKTPIISCGVICLRRYNDDIQVLLIRRKDSLSYVEFVRGKYKPSDPHYVRQLVDGMTKLERERIVNKEFSDLWKNMWISKSYRRHRPEYDKSFSRFEAVKVNIRKYIVDNPMLGWDEPEWGFPKGRPNKNETTHECAMREFREETGISNTKLTIIESPEYEEDYTGTNGILYQNKYIMGSCSENNVGVDPKNRHQAKEISGVQWVSCKNASQYIRKTYPSRLVILENAVKWFEDKYHCE